MEISIVLRGQNGRGEPDGSLSSEVDDTDNGGDLCHF